jgi:hypothetical protein
LLLAGKKHKEKANKEKQKVKENEFPKGAMECSEKDTRKKMIKTKGTDNSVRITENSVGITDSSVRITEKSVRITDHSVGITDNSVGITENSVRITDHSVGITETIVRISDNRVGITDKYVRILERDEETVIVDDALGVKKTKKSNKRPRGLDMDFDQSEFTENLDEKKFKKDV